MIRTLLIDNADSFTFNLFHLLAEVNGCEPVVVPNDWAEYSLAALEDFDNVVISPGPGTPEEPADIGICADVIAHAEIPILGVCLGHQGIAHVRGGTIAHAHEPRHGRVSEIRHSGTGLFEGLPSPFGAARYHSLAVVELPESIEATAWSDDGVLMGLAHTTRPQWGVQFHPESIVTEGAVTLLRNFRRLTEEWWAEQGSSRTTGVDSSRRGDVVGSGERFIRNEAVESLVGTVPHHKQWTYTLHVREMPLAVSTAEIFSALFADEPEAVWLDGNMPGHADSRFSIMGAPTGPLSRRVTADVPAGTLEVRSVDGTETVHSGFFDWLNDDLKSTELVQAPEVAELPFTFSLGWVGYLGYELKAEVGSPGKHASEHPDALIMFLDRALVVDHEQGSVYLLALSGEDVTEDDCGAWFDETTHRIDAIEPDLDRVEPGPAAATHSQLSHGSDSQTDFPPELAARHSRTEYLDLIGEAQRLINDGETYEVCLTNMLEMPWTRDALETYGELRRDNPTPFGAFLKSPEVNVLSTSPERFVRISASGVAESKPIKGTRPRGSTPEEDEALKSDLRTSVKDRSENLMIVDLVRHDLGVTAELGSVEVTKLFDVETYATVHQLVSTVRSQVRDTATPVECIRAAFPPGSMTGAPKHRTMSIIDDLEGGPRGVYSAAVGFFSLDGAVDLSVLIRASLIESGRLRYGVGGALVALSSPIGEYEELVIKAQVLSKLIKSRSYWSIDESPRIATSVPGTR
ncbi:MULTISPECIES: aminodeoxychorismate synthase component I [Brevibacterium]|uniref:aminodeoxychorismate synthase n=1 Tax=Brevibacterium casei TaxID=33889 RepID=A0A7T2TFY8_9MICO|nr:MULTISPECIES: aminodeoxychorismate synthase component I [Brevibacterium]MCM1014250.1 aminodeoxychorismate synthase component I [Brevibacterium sp. XM4083]MCT1550680.1 aminodeoxychorismate synthase component I [Brevibacterium casei]MCT1559990.1 aminodeoxychorismate synthase component I [Brevibacterium casei]MCT2206783.1 aminodeoxychorismate synthase component I [Brevibacterium casei]QPS33196.1 aminodeoxychorismate synthase component I [Brevibacterium casei]